ncbi:hypothetical protein H0H81_010513 [Sphagnurus paluster]|uniref:Cytochrome P450 n=1 Tax=Sphagnurus paluster TaxID=117069 RepID=A0A9P7KG05_9AGAR|nr:hypothetical protein H0H81_010513 [Sphagnurus paluster]
MAGEVILSIAYGIQVQEKDDPYVITAERAVRPISIACVPGTFLVDTIPILKYVPDWVPFASFKRKAKEWRQLAMTMLNMPFETAMRDITTGAIASCILGLLYNPGSLKKAQQEMDSVIGTDRLPTFDDRGSLPYMTAITKEALRWREVSPMGEAILVVNLHKIQ